jgi:hypothetical protein
MRLPFPICEVDGITCLTRRIFVFPAEKPSRGLQLTALTGKISPSKSMKTKDINRQSNKLNARLMKDIDTNRKQVLVYSSKLRKCAGIAGKFFGATQ